MKKLIIVLALCIGCGSVVAGSDINQDPDAGDAEIVAETGIQATAGTTGQNMLDASVPEVCAVTPGTNTCMDASMIEIPNLPPFNVWDKFNGIYQGAGVNSFIILEFNNDSSGHVFVGTTSDGSQSRGNWAGVDTTLMIYTADVQLKVTVIVHDIHVAIPGYLLQ